MTPEQELAELQATEAILYVARRHLVAGRRYQTKATGQLRALCESVDVLWRRVIDEAAAVTSRIAAQSQPKPPPAGDATPGDP